MFGFCSVRNIWCLKSGWGRNWYFEIFLQKSQMGRGVTEKSPEREINGESEHFTATPVWRSCGKICYNM
jgi:hypothetical protein